MDDFVNRILDDVLARGTGPMVFRLVFQPTMATIVAVRDGIRDADSGRPPYLWSIWTQPEERRELLHHGWQSIAKVFALAIVLDLVFQLVVFEWIYPGEAIVVAGTLALVPYVLFRGPTNRLVRLVRRRRAARHG
jgi:hypothetical protein